ncbi:MAG: hypothetical protein ACI8Z5_000426 [Lentimonas sp.]|jgi:hypothetical protein
MAALMHHRGQGYRETDRPDRDGIQGVAREASSEGLIVEIGKRNEDTF